MIHLLTGHNSNLDAILGCLVGTAVGDSLGLPYEGLSPRRAARLLGSPDCHRFFFGRGMVSDDTEQTCMVLQSLLTSSDDAGAFQQDLASRLKYWLATLPAGTGLATARAILKLWIGYSPPASGVFSAGNGPAMRAGILGVMLPLGRIVDYVSASTEITHTDPRARWGAIAVALASHLSSRQELVDPGEYQSVLANTLSSEPADEFLDLVHRAITGIGRFNSAQEFCAATFSKKGVSGYVFHTVPVSIHAWLRHQGNYREAIRDVILCGGDADTTAAIVGGIVGAAVGPEGIPEDWRRGLCDWPLSLRWLKALAQVASEGGVQGNSPGLNLPLPGRLLRNLIFLAIVLGHGFRRLAPPY